MILYPFFLVILGKIHGIWQKYLLMLFHILAGTGPPVESKILTGRRYESPFSVEELLNLVIPKKQSKDDFMDPCKAPAFIGKICSDLCSFKFPFAGDIAYPEGAVSPVQNATVKKSKRRLRDNFDVRDTWSEPRVSRG